MLKKIILSFSIIFLLFWFNITFWASAPEVNCVWLPGCVDTDIVDPTPADISKNLWIEFVWNIIGLLIQIVAVIAVFSLIISWVMYLISVWDEEKVNKAKKWIIWSLAWVFLSISAWGIIEFINGISINN